MSIYTAFRCPEDLLAKAKTKADNQFRSLSNYFITLIAKDVGGKLPVVRARRAKKTAGPRSRR